MATDQPPAPLLLRPQTLGIHLPDIRPIQPVTRPSRRPEILKIPHPVPNKLTEHLSRQIRIRQPSIPEGLHQLNGAPAVRILLQGLRIGPAAALDGLHCVSAVLARGVL